MDPHDARGSEQNWQGIIHNWLGIFLAVFAGEQYNIPNDYDDDSGVAFLFRAVSNPQNPSAARIYYEDNGVLLENVNTGTPFRRRTLEESAIAYNVSSLNQDQLNTANLENLGFIAIDLVIDDTSGNMTIKLPNGDEIPADDDAAIHESIRSGMTNTTFTTNVRDSMESNFSSTLASAYALSPDVSQTESGNYRGFRIDVDGAGGFSLSNKVETQRQLIEGPIDILAIGAQYIRGSTSSSNSTSNGTNTNSTDSAHRISHRGAHQRLKHKRQTATVEGPVQCGPGQPCLDGSCCKQYALICLSSLQY